MSFSRLMLVLCGACILLFPGALTAQAAEKNDLQVWGLRSHLPQGKTIECEATLEPNQTPQSAEFTPAEGIAASDWKLLGKDPFTTKKRVTWTFRVTIDKDAALGERDMVLVTQDGRTSPKKVSVVTHIPVLSDFKIISTQLSPGEIQFSFNAFDEFGDLPDLTSPMCCVSLIAPPYIVVGSQTPKKVTKVDEKTYLVEIIVSYAGSTFIAGRSGQLSFNLADKNGYQSQELTGSVTF